MAQRMREFKRLPELRFEHVDVGQAVEVMVLIDKLAAERRAGGGSGADDEGLDFEAGDDEAFAEYDEDEEWEDDEDWELEDEEE